MSARVKSQRKYTPEEFEKLPDTHGYELVGGRLVRKAMGIEASWVQGKIGRLLGTFVDAAQLGYVLESESGYACFPPHENKVRKPDVSFVRRGRFEGNRLPTGNATIPPDLVVEVVSPQEKAYKLHAKIRDFQSVGVPVIWVVYPNTRTIQVLSAGVPDRWLNVGDTLTGDPVLPGFSVPVADLFPPPATP
jgi:Uma2 family endonuclease